MHIVLDLNFHSTLLYYFFMQMCVFQVHLLCYLTYCYEIQLLLLLLFWFCIMSIVAMKETKLLIIMMDFGIKDGVFITKVFNRYGAFD